MFVVAGITGTTGQTDTQALLVQHRRVRLVVRGAAIVGAWRHRGAQLAQATLGACCSLFACRVRTMSRSLFSFLLASFVGICGGGGGSTLALAAPALEAAAGIGSQPHGVAVSNGDLDDAANRGDIAAILKS